MPEPQVQRYRVETDKGAFEVEVEVPAAAPSHEPPLDRRIANGLQDFSQWAGNVISGLFMGPEGPKLVENARNRPALAAGELTLAALPSALRLTKPMIGRGAGAMADVLEHPAVDLGGGALLGALSSDGSPGDILRRSVIGAGAGAMAGVPAARMARGIERRYNPDAVASNRMVRGMSEAGNQGGTLVRPEQPESLEDALTAMLREGMAPSQVELSPSHPVGGGFTTPPPVSPNAGGRLVKSQPGPTLEDSLTGALQPEAVATQLPPSHPQGGGFTVPPTMPSPNAGGRLVPGAPKTTVQDLLTPEGPQSSQLGLSHPTGGGFTTPPPVDAPPAPSPNAGGRLGGQAQSLEDSLIEALKGAMGGPQPSHVSAPPQAPGLPPTASSVESRARQQVQGERAPQPAPAPAPPAPLPLADQPPTLGDLRNMEGARSAAADPRLKAVSRELGIPLGPNAVRDITGGPSRLPGRAIGAEMDRDFLRLMDEAILRSLTSRLGQ